MFLFYFISITLQQLNLMSSSQSSQSAQYPQDQNHRVKSKQNHSTTKSLFTTPSTINSVYVERNDEKRKIIFYIPTYIYMKIFNASDIKIQERNISLHASIKVKFYTQGISQYLGSEQILNLLGIQQQDLYRIDLQKLYSPLYSLKNQDRKKVIVNFGLNKSRTPDLAPNTISDILSLQRLITIEMNQKLSFTVQQSNDWWYRYLYLFTPTYLLNLQQYMMVENLVIPINFTNPVQEKPYTIQYYFNFMEAPRQSQKFTIHPKLQTFGQYQLADNLISINFSNLEQSKQYIHQRKISKQETQAERQKQHYFLDYDKFATEFLDLEENVKDIRSKITGDSQHESDSLIQNEDLIEAKQKWQNLYQKHHMKTKQALRYASVTGKTRQVTFRNWKFVHFQIPIYKRPHRDLFTVSIPLVILAIITFYLFWIARTSSSRQAFAGNMIIALIILSNALVPISRISKPHIIGVGFYEFLIFLSLIPPMLLLLFIGVANTDEQLGKSFEQTQIVRRKYMIVAFSVECLIIVILVFSTVFYACLRRRQSLRSKALHDDRTCCLKYHLLRVEHNQYPRGKIFNLKKWYNNQCCRNFVLYGKKRMRDWHKQYLNRKKLNLQSKSESKKEFIKLPLHHSSQHKNQIVSHQVKQDFYVQNPTSDVRLKH